mgnify:FL=1
MTGFSLALREIPVMHTADHSRKRSPAHGVPRHFPALVRLNLSAALPFCQSYEKQSTLEEAAPSAL